MVQTCTENARGQISKETLYYKTGTKKNGGQLIKVWIEEVREVLDPNQIDYKIENIGNKLGR